MNVITLAIEALLEPGESIVQHHEFTTELEVMNPLSPRETYVDPRVCDVVLTDRYLRFCFFKRSILTRRPPRFDFDIAIRLADVKSITLKQMAGQLATSRKRGSGTLVAFSAHQNDGSNTRLYLAEDTDASRGFIRAVEARVRSSDKSLSTRSIADELAHLAGLRDAGILNEDDWERAKSLFLGAPANTNDERVRLLKNLHDLYKSGVLSEGEFNIKKWDVLSSR